jgi:hypothetical protein
MCYIARKPPLKRKKLIVNIFLTCRKHYQYPENRMMYFSGNGTAGEFDYDSDETN